MTREQLEGDVRTIMNEGFGLGRRMGACQRVYAHDDEQRRVIEQQAKRIQELEEWQKIVTGTGTDQEAVVRMAATEYTKVAVQCWKEKCEQQAQQIATLKSELSQRTNLEGSAPCWNSAHMKQIATLREALGKLIKEIDGILGIGEEQIRNIVGNTNVNVLHIKIATAQQALKEHP